MLVAAIIRKGIGWKEEGGKGSGYNIFNVDNNVLFNFLNKVYHRRLLQVKSVTMIG